MPGRGLETTSKMGVYKLAFSGPETMLSPATKSTPFRPGRRSANMIPTARVVLQPMASSSSPELERFVASTPADAVSEDDAASVFTASTRTSNTVSDDDISLADFGVRSVDYTPARHSTACCTDLALRRELRKKFLHVEPALDEATDSTVMGHSFRRELDMEDRVESLALWEETDNLSVTISNPHRTISKDMPHSWHGDTASSMSTRNKPLESLFRKPKKASSNFFNAFFSSLTFSTSRRSRKP